METFTTGLDPGLLLYQLTGRLLLLNGEDYTICLSETQEEIADSIILVK